MTYFTKCRLSMPKSSNILKQHRLMQLVIINIQNLCSSLLPIIRNSSLITSLTGLLVPIKEDLQLQRHNKSFCFSKRDQASPKTKYSLENLIAQKMYKIHYRILAFLLLFKSLIISKLRTKIKNLNFKKISNKLKSKTKTIKSLATINRLVRK